jgi:hypothetical protein
MIFNCVTLYPSHERTQWGEIQKLSLQILGLFVNTMSLWHYNHGQFCSRLVSDFFDDENIVYFTVKNVFTLKK